MFEREITLNRFLLGGFQQIMADIPAERINERPAGNGHPPLWILGHLALCAEFTEMVLGGELVHPEWMPVFGPGSPDEVQNPDQYSKDDLVSMIMEGYPKACEIARAATEEAMARPHGVELLADTPIATTGDLVAHLLGTHFSFHLAQLSGWRRAAGHGPLF